MFVSLIGKPNPLNPDFCASINRTRKYSTRPTTVLAPQPSPSPLVFSNDITVSTTRISMQPFRLSNPLPQKPRKRYNSRSHVSQPQHSPSFQKIPKKNPTTSNLNKTRTQAHYTILTTTGTTIANLHYHHHRPSCPKPPSKHLTHTSPTPLHSPPQLLSSPQLSPRYSTKYSPKYPYLTLTLTSPSPSLHPRPHLNSPTAQDKPVAIGSQQSHHLGRQPHICRYVIYTHIVG